MTLPVLILAAVIGISSAGAAWAQAPTPITLSDAIAKAMETSHQLAEARARQEGAEAAVQVQRVADQPTLSVGGGYTRTNHVDQFFVPAPIGPPRLIYPDLPNNYFTHASFQWPIYSGGRFDALERAAAAEARASAEDVATARADLRLEVVRVYWALATAGESVRVLEEAVARADAHLRDVRARFDAGLIPPNDVSSVEAQRSREELQLIEARNIRQSLVEDLKRLTGLSDDLSIAERLDASSGAPAETGTPPVNRSEQRAIAERLTAADERIRGIESGRRPTLAVAGGADYANPNPKIFPREEKWQPSWELGVNVNWTLWDGGRIDASVAEAAAARKALRERQADLDLQIATDIRQRQLDLDSARASLTAASDGARSAAEARRVVAERFNVGVATNTEVLDAQYALLQADLDRTRALANIKLAEARLDRALGR
jgi:outer membrane protein TolC